MWPYGVVCVLSWCMFIYCVKAQCSAGRSVTFSRWSGVAPEGVAPVFVYSASGEEESLAGACLARCRELDDCAGVVVAYGRGNCHGLADSTTLQLRTDNDVAYFKKICLELPEECSVRWWALESTPGYHLHTENTHLKVILNTTVHECYDAVISSNGDVMYRSAQWVLPHGTFDAEVISTSDSIFGNCILNKENRFTEPESYRVSNYYTFYIENQCRHDYSKKIDRCSYEEYFNQTLKHVEYTYKNFTQEECKTSCEVSERFICRGFTWIAGRGARGARRARGLCDLHSEDLVTAGSWLLRRTAPATYYRRVVCFNISVECEGSDMIVTYRPRGVFRGRVYVPGRGERCSARGAGAAHVRLALPLHGDCDVKFAYGISNGPNGVINRTMAYVMLMIQNNPIIQTAGDRWLRVGCSPGLSRAPTKVNASFAVKDVGSGNTKPSSMTGNEIHLSVSPAAASAVYGASPPAVAMYVVRALDDSGAGSVSLGEPLELRIETTDANEIKAYHLVASSRMGDSSVLLLDNRGCPTGQVDFPAFTRSWLGGTQRMAWRFKAFRFPTSHVVRFTLLVRFCDSKCPPVECTSKNQGRSARQTNETYYEWSEDGVPAAVRLDAAATHGARLDAAATHGARLDAARGVVAAGGTAPCGSTADDSVALQLEMFVDSRDILSADTLVRADHRSTLPEDGKDSDGAMVCVHELLLVALVLAWLAVQVLLLLGCCVLVKRYRNLAELSMQKDYHSFDNVGFDTGSTHRRVHWPDQNIDILHAH